MEELRNKLIMVVNEAQLPAEAVYYVVKDFYRDVADSYKNYLEAVAQQKAQEESQEEKEEE